MHRPCLGAHYQGEGRSHRWEQKLRANRTLQTSRRSPRVLINPEKFENRPPGLTIIYLIFNEVVPGI
jgi:hypothetical protein